MKRQFIKGLTLLLVVSILLSCSGCTVKISAKELSKDYQTQTSQVMNISDSFVKETADFSLALFKKLVTKDAENDLVSPISALYCLALIANGANGQTKKQMEEVFGMDVSTLNQQLYAYAASLYNGENCKLNLANSIWFYDNQDELHVNEEFLQTNANWYNAQVYATPFDNTTLNDINAWCKKYTDGMIEKMIDSINPGTIMYLINAVAFDAKWAVKYENSDVKDGLFTNYDSVTKTVKMLSSQEFNYLSSDNACGFTKNYEGDKYSFVGILPNEGIDVYDYVNSLDGQTWIDLWNSKETGEVYVQMPEFTYNASMDLTDVLKQMGMVDMFDAGADFSNIGASNRGNIYCSEVRQKTYIQVDRNGTKAAAITWGGMKNTAIAEPKRVYLNRPFVYAIVDNETHLPIFIGVVTNL